MNYYRQCTLQKGPTSQVAWIPEELAKVNKHVKIGDDDGWKVLEASTTRQSEEYILSHERDHMGHRNRTDI